MEQPFVFKSVIFNSLQEEYGATIDEVFVFDIIGQKLGFCGCGLPEDAIDYCYQGLKRVESLALSKSDFPNPFASEGEEYFFFYWLDKKGFTEHGGSVPGWLTEKGKDMILAIEEAREYTRIIG